MITKFAAMAALDEAFVRHLNHLCDMYFSGDDERAATDSLLRDIELTARRYRKAKAALDDARNLTSEDD